MDGTDQQTLLLMTHFYNYIIDGQPRSKALHSAELDIKKDYPHPFFWEPSFAKEIQDLSKISKNIYHSHDNVESRISI